MITALVFMLATLAARDSSPATVTGADSLAVLVAPDPCEMRAQAGDAAQLRILPKAGWSLRRPYKMTIVFDLSTEPGTPVAGTSEAHYVPEASTKSLRFDFAFPKFVVTKDEQVGLLVQLQAATDAGPFHAFTEYSFGPCTVAP